MISLLLFLQVSAGGATTRPAGGDTGAYASDNVRAIVARAAALNRRVPAALQSYRAQLESEISLISRQPGGYEQTVQLEQMASDLRWERTGAMEQHVVGYRSQQAAVNISALTYLRDSWIVPVLYGNRITLFFGIDSAKARTRVGGAVRQRRYQAIHPLADDRDEIYRFSGGDTVVTLRAGGRSIPIVRVQVQPRRVPRERMLVFRGELDLDATRSQLVRMRGEFVTLGRKKSIGERVMETAVESAFYMELVNHEVNGEFWLPTYQRIEGQAQIPISGDTRAVIRVLTQFRSIVPAIGSAVTLAVVRDTSAISADTAAAARVDTVATAAATADGDTLRALPHRLTMAPADSLARYDAWGAPIGQQTAGTRTEDFDDLAPDIWRPTGRPRLDLHPMRFSDVARFNKVEGLYLAVPLRFRFRDAAPGLSLHAQGGRAFGEKTWRGTGAVALDRGNWQLGARGGRTLWSTLDFLAPWDEGLRIDPIFEGRDDADYVDRRFASLSVARVLNAAGRRDAVLRVESGPASDRVTLRHVEKAGLFELADSSFRNARWLKEGRWIRSLATLEINPSVAEAFVRPGLGLRMTYERGDGDLRFQRLEARLAGRRNAGPFTFFGSADGGAVLLKDTVPQQMYELGGLEGLTGYDPQTFGGDRVWLTKTTAMWTGPWLRTPIPFRIPLLGWRLFLPGLSPGLATSLHAGWANATTAQARRSLQLLGQTPDPITGLAIADPEGRLHAPIPTGSIRSTVELTARFFGGGVAIGAARPIDHREGWTLVFRLGEGM